MYWFCINLSRSWFVWILNFRHFTRDCVGKFAAKMHNLQNSKEPWFIEIYAEPLYTFERGGSEVSFDTKTFTCVYVNFCSFSITIKPILCENYTSTKVERILSHAVMYLFYCKIDGSGFTPVNGSWNLKIWFSWVPKYIVCINKA